MLIGFGIVWLVLDISLIGSLGRLAANSSDEFIGVSGVLAIIIFLAIPSIILFIIAISKWNSEREFKNLKQRARINIHMKGRLKDLR